MASIKGVALKGIKTFNGREGIGMEANIYLDGKKVGHYFDEASGGEPYIDFERPADAEIVAQRSAAFFNEHPHQFANVDFFLVILGDLIESEKAYKKGVKKGYNVLVCADLCSDNYEGIYYHVKTGALPVDKNDIANRFAEKIPEARVFASLDDFIIA